jgi:hypothetical protein
VAYTDNPDVLRQRLAEDPGLQQLERWRSAAWNTDPGDARRVAIRVREALYIAAQHPEDFPELAVAAEHFSVHVVSPTRVEARPKRVPKTEASTLADSANKGSVHPDNRSVDSPVHGIGEGLQLREVPRVGLVNAAQVVDAWMKHLPSNDPLLFTETVLPYSELLTLYRWCSTKTPKLMFFVSEQSKLLTLSLREAGVYADSWHPLPPAPKEEKFDI